jgi:P4 family phage/plasmid primase-like protien
MTQIAIPQIVIDLATHLHRSVIPVGIDKLPLVKWKAFQSQRADIDQIEAWQKQFHPPLWGQVTGSISSIITLDHDGAPGRETMEALKLSPHRRTGSGGFQTDFVYPGWYVKTENSKSSAKKPWVQTYPGLDIRGDGGYAAIAGRNKSGPYEWLRDPADLDSLDILPADLREWLGLLYAPESSIAERALEKYLAEAHYKGRDNACFELAVQLRDNDYSQSEALKYCTLFAQRVHTTNQKGEVEPFTEADARIKVASAYSYTKREPWASTTSYRSQQEAPSTSNGHQKPCEHFNLTDLGNAERFAAKHHDTVRWCETWNTWMVFTGKCWEPDRMGRVDQLAKIVVRSIYHEAANEADDTIRTQIVKHARASESSRSIRALLDRAKSELPVVPDEFNTHLYLLNCDNGTLDLRNGELHPHSPRSMLTRCLKVRYNPLALCSQWRDFIKSIFANDTSLMSFMQQALGMSLCGDISEQCLFICYGTGSNGKTTMLETVRIIMASYALAANIETFQMHKHEGIGNDIAELYGARLVTASENALGSRLNEAFIKKATGKEPLRARRLHENEFEFMPEFTIWFAVNHKPVVKDTSRGMWRRVHFIPFNVTIDNPDKHLGEKLLDESEGVLAWLVQGCIEWYKQGHLEPPKTVKDATDTYRGEMDVVAQFLEECCETSPNAEIGATKLYQAYKRWCENNGERYEKQTSFGLQLAEKGYIKEKVYTVKYLGVKLRENVDSVDSVDSFPISLTREKNTNQKIPENCLQLSTLSTNSKIDKPEPPQRACFKCGVQNWQWNAETGMYACEECSVG